MTREHLYFIPFVFALGITVGAWFGRSGATARLESQKLRLSQKSLLFPFLLFLGLFVLTHALGAHGGPRAVQEQLGGASLFDQRASFPADEVYARMAAFGALGRAAYQRLTFTTDLVFPLSLFALLVQLLRFVRERSPQLSPRDGRLLLLLPTFWLLADLGENALIYWLLELFPARHDGWASRLGYVTHLKFALLVASVAAPAWLGLTRAQQGQRPGVSEPARVTLSADTRGRASNPPRTNG